MARRGPYNPACSPVQTPWWSLWVRRLLWACFRGACMARGALAGTWLLRVARLVIARAGFWMRAAILCFANRRNRYFHFYGTKRAPPAEKASQPCRKPCHCPALAGNNVFSLAFCRMGAIIKGGKSCVLCTARGLAICAVQCAARNRKGEWT